MSTQMAGEKASEAVIPESEKTPWWKRTAGIFANEPMFDSVMRTIDENREREREEANRLADKAETIQNQAGHV